jgi:ATP-dependent Clp protease ATP-binding subunit ClpX
MATFDDERIKRIVALADQKQQQDKRHWTPKEVFERLDEAIIGNVRYKQALAICISDFVGDSNLRNHLLIVGPSGSGKTYLLQECLPDFDLPYKLVDASGLVPAGYKGLTLQEALEDFFKSNALAARKAIIVLDEFDKISEKANGGDIHKSHSLQSELLTLIQGKQEGAIDTRGSLWILAGAFAYADEMRNNPPQLSKTDLLKYGFKNELLGRITKMTMTDIPTIEDVVRRVAKDKVVRAFLSDLKGMEYDVDFADDAFLELAMAAQSPTFGMRIIPSAIAELKQHIVFNCNKGNIVVTKEMVGSVLKGVSS